MLANRVRSIKPSPTLAIDAKAKELKSSGVDIVNFGIGEPDFDTPENIKEAAIKAIRDGFTKYTPASGIVELKDAIIEKLKNDNGLDYTRDEIVVSCGAKHSLYNIAQAILSPGDEVLIPSPYWVSYPDQVILNDAVPVIVDTEEKDNFKLNPESLERHITDRTKALILNSPSNPTGFAYARETLERVAEIAIEKGIFIISDEIYEKIIYDGFRHISIASLGDDVKAITITVNGLSKSHCMTGWRIGYAAGPRDIIKAMTNIQSQSTSNPNSIAQKAAVEALKGNQDSIKRMVSEFKDRRDFIVAELNKIRGLSCPMPQGAFYVFPRVDGLYGKGFNGWSITSSSELSLYLLEEAEVAVVPGAAFGKDAYIRLSYATSIGQIKKGVERLKKACEQLS